MYISDLVGKGLDLKIFGQLFFYASISMVPLALPVSVLLSSIMTFGNFGEHFELTAMKAAGISLYRIIKPVMILSLIFTILAFVFANNIVPYANLRLYSLIFDIRQKHPALNIQEGIFNYDIDGYVIKVDKKNYNTGMMYGFLIYDHVNYFGNRFVLTADSGRIYISSDMNYLVLELFSGCSYEELDEKTQIPQERKYPYHQDFFDFQRVIIPLEGFHLRKTDISFFRHNYKMLKVSALKIKIDSLKELYNKKLNFYARILLLNDILKNQRKLRSYTDSVNLLDKLKILNNIPPDSLKIIYNLDSAFNAQNLHNRKEILHAATSFANTVLTKLNIYSQEAKARKSWLATHQITYHERFVYALACLIFFFIGAPLGSIIRRSGFGIATIVSTLLFLMFYSILMVGERLVKDGNIPAYIGIWLAPAIFIPLEIFIFYKAYTDSVLINYDIYIDRLKKFIEKITPKYFKRQRIRKAREKIRKKRISLRRKNKKNENKT